MPNPIHDIESSIDVPPFMGYLTLFLLLTFALGVSFGYYLGARDAAAIVARESVKK